MTALALTWHMHWTAGFAFCPIPHALGPAASDVQRYSPKNTSCHGAGGWGEWGRGSGAGGLKH